VGYNYVTAVGGTSGDYPEHRGVLEATPSIPLTDILLFSDRNRAEIRSVDGSTSSRYRDRIRVERRTKTDLITLNPFQSAEFFYGSRYSAWNRTMYTIGSEWTLATTAILENSYQRRNASISAPATVNPLGLTLSLFS
jgi:hypothetical protein